MRPLKEGNLLATFAFADQFLFLFDYDGTLSNIVSDPSQAIIAETELHQMHKLASEPKHTVWVISGRDRTFLQTQLGNLTNIGLAAEHGAFMRRPGSQDWKNMALEADLHWRPHVKKVFDAFVLQTPGARLEQKETALVLHYREAEQHDVVTAQALRCKHDLEGQVGTSGVKIIRGKCSIEARPAIVDKGLTVKTILEQFQRLNGKLPNFTLCVGDDVTDEGTLLPNLTNDISLIVFRYVSCTSCQQTFRGVHCEDRPHHRGIECGILSQGSDRRAYSDRNSQRAQELTCTLFQAY